MKKIITAILLTITQAQLQAGWVFYDSSSISQVRPNSYRVNPKTEEVSASYANSPFSRRFMIFWNSCAATNFVVGGSIGLLCTDQISKRIWGGRGIGHLLSMAITGGPAALVTVKGLSQLKKAYDAGDHWNSDNRYVVGKLSDLQTPTYYQPNYQPQPALPVPVKEDQQVAAQAATK